MIEIKAPKRFETVYLTGKSIFLAGSIEMGKAELWQDKVTYALRDLKINIYNPRRDDWDPSWEQSMSNPLFVDQVNWELDHIASADLVLFYFDPKTLSPITMLELGYVGKSKIPSIVCCPDGFWRQGNVEIFAGRENMSFVKSFDEMINMTKRYLKEGSV